eukprot:GEMP01038022.1.p1 GENE.GEMP01038022.1~~GEMP01038022.1.p1  ORF type:complete len:181 (+),score=50.55 GEMP01038022.1:63-605(+)
MANLDKPSGSAGDVKKKEKEPKPEFKHSLLFENPDGIPSLMELFPAAREQFKGPGQEFKDLTRMMDVYRKWARQLYPYGLHFDDFVKKLEKSLGNIEKRTNLNEEDSDPQEYLLKLRFLHKTGMKVEEATKAAQASASGTELTPEEKKRRIEENRQKALAKRQARLAANLQKEAKLYQHP